MAETASTPKTTEPEETEFPDSNVDQVETENLSSKLSNIPVLNSSLQTVSKTCHTIKESNSYVGYGMTVAESSLDTAFKAGKAVLDSRTLAPITNTAMENIRYLDKEAGIMVDKLLKNGNQEGEMQANGAVQGLSTTTESGSLAFRQESMFYFLGRKFVEITSLLILWPYFGPKYALSTIWGLFQGSSTEAGRKRKERGSMSEEVKYMEPSPVKRKYGDRQSTSSEEETLVEILREYVSEDDPDYEPEEHETDESSGDESSANGHAESVQECLDLSQNLEEMGIRLSPTTQKDLEKLKGASNECETNKSQSTTNNASESAQTQPRHDLLHANDDKIDQTTTKSKTEKKTADSKTNGKAEQKLEEIPLQEVTSKSKDTTEILKDLKESKTSKIDPSSKTRRSSKSPLLEKLLSPGRRSRKSQKEKTKSAEKENVESSVVAEDAAAVEGSSHLEDISTKTKSEKMADISENSIEDSSKNVAKTEVHELTKSKESQKDESQKSKGKSGKGKSESSKGEIKIGESRPETELLSTVSGPFDVFKFGGKKSK